jgi:hypothetical protein
MNIILAVLHFRNKKKKNLAESLPRHAFSRYKPTVIEVQPTVPSTQPVQPVRSIFLTIDRDEVPGFRACCTGCTGCCAAKSYSAH